jgi:hypothetical protein
MTAQSSEESFCKNMERFEARALLFLFACGQDDLASARELRDFVNQSIIQLEIALHEISKELGLREASARDAIPAVVSDRRFFAAAGGRGS